MPPAADERREKQAAAQQAVDILHEISTILVSDPLNPLPRLVLVALAGSCALSTIAIILPLPTYLK